MALKWTRELALRREVLDEEKDQGSAENLVPQSRGEMINTTDPRSYMKSKSWWLWTIFNLTLFVFPFQLCSREFTRTIIKRRA
jgi:hypothetical protein